MYPSQLASYDLNNQSFYTGVIWNQNRVQQTNIGMSNEIKQKNLSSNNDSKENGTKKDVSQSNKTEKSSKKNLKKSSTARTSSHNPKLSKQSSQEVMTAKKSVPLLTSYSVGTLRDRIGRERRAHTMAPFTRISGPSSSPKAKMFASIIAPSDSQAVKSTRPAREKSKTTSASRRKPAVAVNDDDDAPIIVKVQYDPTTGVRPSEDTVRRAIANQLKQRSGEKHNKDPIVINPVGQIIQPRMMLRPPQQYVFNRPMLPIQQTINHSFLRMPLSAQQQQIFQQRPTQQISQPTPSQPPQQLLQHRFPQPPQQISHPDPPQPPRQIFQQRPTQQISQPTPSQPPQQIFQQRPPQQISQPTPPQQIFQQRFSHSLQQISQQRPPQQISQPQPPQQILQQKSHIPPTGPQASRTFLSLPRIPTVQRPQHPFHQNESDTFKPIKIGMATGQESATVNTGNSTNVQQTLQKRPHTVPSGTEVFRPPKVSDIPELSQDSILSMLKQIPDLQGRQFNIEYAPSNAPDGYPIPLNLDGAGNKYPESVFVNQLPNNVIQHVKSSNNPAITAALEASIQQEQQQHGRSAGQHPPPGPALQVQPPTVIRHAAPPNRQVQKSPPALSNDSDSSSESSSSGTSSSEESEDVPLPKPSNNIPFVGPNPPTSYSHNQYR